MDEMTMYNFARGMDSVYLVFRAVGHTIREAYTCDTKEEIEVLRERMESFAGEFCTMAKAN